MQNKLAGQITWWKKGNRKKFTFVLGPINHIPSDAVHAGKDKDGGNLYAGKAYHEGCDIPGFISPKLGGAFVVFKGKQLTKMEFEILQTTQAAWKYASNGQVPPGAIVFGTSSDGEKLYLGRVMHNGCVTPGCVQPSHGNVAVPYDGKVITFKEYEVLIMI